MANLEPTFAVLMTQPSLIPFDPTAHFRAHMLTGWRAAAVLSQYKSFIHNRHTIQLLCSCPL